MKVLNCLVFWFLIATRLGAEEWIAPEKYFSREMLEFEIGKNPVSGGVVYFLEDGEEYVFHRIAERVAKTYFESYRQRISLNSFLGALNSDDVFVRDASFEVLKLYYSNLNEFKSLYNPFDSKKKRTEGIKKLIDLTESLGQK